MLTDLLTVLSGSAVGFFLGFLGGGASIMAVPLLLYLVGIGDVHLAIGTSAVAAAVSAAFNLALHAKHGTVKWPCAIAFALSGSVGALLGRRWARSPTAKTSFSLLRWFMVGVGVSMLTRKPEAGDPDVRISPKLAAGLIPTGLLTGVASGFFGIGGGFLIVPGLIGVANITMLNAIGSSLVGVTAFSAATAASYALSNLAVWNLAFLFVVGGAAGGFLGQMVGHRLASKKGGLNKNFATFIFVTAAYMAVQSLAAF